MVRCESVERELSVVGDVGIARRRRRSQHSVRTCMVGFNFQHRWEAWSVG